MAARGNSTKQKIIQKILQTFPGSFTYNDGKEIRINDTEDGTLIQIKVTLTAAKVPVESDSINFVDENTETTTETVNTSAAAEKVPEEPTEDEKARLTTLLENLGL